MLNVRERVIPYWRILSDEQLAMIHARTVEVMEGTGVAVHSREAFGLLKQAGADCDGCVVRVPESMLAKALRSAPGNIMAYDRNMLPAMKLEPGYSYFGPGSDTTFTQDVLTGQRRISDLDTVRSYARLVDSLPNMDFVMSMGRAPETEAGRADQAHFLAMLENTSKPILFTAQTPSAMRDIAGLCALVSEPSPFREKPFAVLYAMPTSPLTHTDEALQTMLVAADAGIPCIYASGCMSGASGPVTIAGTLVTANVEMLTGLVIHQLRRPGAPFVYGAVLGPLEMKSAVNIYCGPESMLMQVASLQLGRYYNLPTFATGGCSDAKLFDQQASAEISLSLMTAAMAGGNMIHDSGYLESGNCSSHEALVFADEMISQVRFLLNGFSLGKEDFAVDVIDRVGIGGNYMADDHTLDHFRETVWYPRLMDHRLHSAWQAAGAQDLGSSVRKRAVDALNNHEPQLLPQDVLAKLRQLA